MKYINKQVIYLTTLAIALGSCSKSKIDETTTPGPDPEPQPQEYYWASVSSGQAHALALSEEGGIYVWGDNSEGQLGNGSQAVIAKPTKLAATQKWVKATTGYAHSLAIAEDGTLWAWGKNDEGQLGLGNYGDDVLVPTQVGTDKDWTTLAVGGSYSLALKKDGTLWTWGSHSSGSLGNGQTSGRTTSPTKVGADTNWKAIYAFNNWGASFAIKSDGSLWAWGKGQNYMLGTGSTSNQPAPVNVGIGKKWKTVASDRSRNTFAIAEEGTLWAVGRNNKGLLQLGTTAAQTEFAQVGSDTDWENIATFNLSFLATKKNGDLYAWGENTYGELGNGTINSASNDELALKSITKIANQSNVKALAVGFNFSVLLKDKSKSLCIAGSNIGDFPSLGTGTATSAPILTHQCDITLY
ncbi:hypothetical protein [Sphingobacterium sp.]|uniref:RCC1 domain-containing protein n=1 Tax=Sphingobacterium sp. TaxID=341027 RepID=UPI00258A36F3|nr:hypothetical protein [Sphingobacterium sp.]WET68006.1 MAG: hypothetical protein P0Y57_19375 [Sphingobacterium sp.]